MQLGQEILPHSLGMNQHLERMFKGWFVPVSSSAAHSPMFSGRGLFSASSAPWYDGEMKPHRFPNGVMLAITAMALLNGIVLVVAVNVALYFLAH